MKKDAILSDCRSYRFALWRTWDETKKYAMIIGLNPSTADEIEDDNTITRCINFSKSWGYGGLCMANLFAFRATNPMQIRNINNPIGDKNDEYIIDLAKNAGIVIAAWGNHGIYMNRANHIKNIISNLHYLALNKTGEPKHPLYLKSNSIPIKF